MYSLNIFIATINEGKFQILSSYIIYGLMIIAIILLIWLCIRMDKRRRKK